MINPYNASMELERRVRQIQQRLETAEMFTKWREFSRPVPCDTIVTPLDEEGQALTTLLLKAAGLDYGFKVKSLECRVAVGEPVTFKAELYATASDVGGTLDVVPPKPFPSRPFLQPAFQAFVDSRK